LKVRVSSDERATIRDRAAANGLDVSEHVRRASMSYGVTLPARPVLEAELVGVDGQRFGPLRRLWRSVARRS